ncbi:MAG: helix-turn-helix transcriptional regulator [Lachnobacterium sp.]|nr:helix-turn-helix transcriptional regulator [Lachnobacterium sp.]
MDGSQASVINQIDRDFLIDTLTDELPVLRARIGIKQEELSDILGISRQTYSAIETKKRKMTWNMFISLLMFFTQNKKTAPVIEMIGAFPDELKNIMNVDYRR